MRSVLLQLHVAVPASCESWGDAPVAHGVQVTVYVDSAGGGPELMARRVHAAFERELVHLGAKRAPAPCAPGIFGAHTCSGAVQGLAGRVLAFVADGTGRIDPSIETYFGAPGTVVIPIVDRSLTTQPNTVLPASMQTQLAERTTGFDPAPVISRLVRGAGILARSNRLFISYRHSDASHFAGELFHALVERGFEPFLDRFSSRPGDDFVDLIRDELADKAILVSLETAGIGGSLYCRQEVATAVSRRMGMIAVDLAGSVATFRVIAKRIDARSLGPRPVRTALKGVVDQIEAHAAHEALRRPRWQDMNLQRAIAGKGRSAVPAGLGRYVVQYGFGYRLVAMFPGLPQTGDFIQVEEQRDAVPCIDAAIFGPLAAARTNRTREVGWLRRKSGVAVRDEGQLMRFV